MLRQRFQPQPSSVQGTTLGNRQYYISVNANSGRQNIHILELPEGDIRFQYPAEIFPGSEIQVICERTLALIEVEPSLDQNDASRLASLVERHLEQELYRLNKKIPTVTIEEKPLKKSGDLRLLSMVGLICVAFSSTLRFLPAGGIPDDIGYLIIALFVITSVLSFLLKYLSASKQLALVALSFCILLTSVLWLNMAQVSTSVERGQVFDIVRASGSSGPLVTIRVTRAEDLKELSFFVDHDTDFEVGDFVEFDIVTGLLHFTSTQGLRLVKSGTGDE